MGTFDSRARCRGALVGVAVADALGAPFEGQAGPIAASMIARVETAGALRRYTDDTAMTIAVAESLLFSDGLDQNHLARTFAVRYERDPDRGYSQATASLLRRIGSGHGWKQAAAQQFAGRGSFRNGAPMRVSAIGLWAPDAASAGELGRGSAEITHTHPQAVDAAGVQAAAVWLAAHSDGAGTLEPHRFIDALLTVSTTKNLAERLVLAGELADAPVDTVIARIGNGLPAIEAVPAAVCAFLHHVDSFVDTVRFAICLGGDTDTIASMAAAISGAHLGETAIPDDWSACTEGVGYLQELADRIANHRDRQ